MRDIREIPLLVVPVFEIDRSIEPGESIDYSKVFGIELPDEEIVWLKVSLRVESEDREWNLTRFIRVEIVDIPSR